MNAKYYLLTLLAACCLASAATARTFHLDSKNGDDANDGLTAATPWKTLAKAGSITFKPGDRLQLKRGSFFKGGLSLQLQGSPENPIEIGAFGKGNDPVIDARGHTAGVYLRNSHHVLVRDLQITADGGLTVDGSKPNLRFGVLIRGTYGATSHITIERLTIYKIFPEVGTEHEGHHSTTFMGSGISIEGSRNKPCTDFIVRNCRIAQTGFKAINLKHIRNVQILNNRMKDIGGPAIQPGNVNDLVVRGNTVDGSGSNLDPRMHARGSGIWPWTCNNVLIEKNKFMHARGKGDSCGVHIDFNCRNVVIQYNLSLDNEGGFVEILGNNHNCAYRYNISINDGSREKGKNKAFQEGKILWTSGYTGSKNKKHGPYNSYIYNNTIYVKSGTRSCFSIAPTTDGLLVANNIFHIMGKTVDVLGDQDGRTDKPAQSIPGVLFQNNLYTRDSILPPSLPFTDTKPIIGNPDFMNPGSDVPEDYIPRNKTLVKDRGIPIPLLSNDELGLQIGLEVKEDFFGNPIIGKPDLGAIEISRPTESDYKLVWSDEFNENGKPNPDNWTYEHGFVRNNELQWYQPDNASCSNGMLVIEGRREWKPNPNHKPGSNHWKIKRKGAEYTSACLKTKGLHSWQYGRFEMRAKIDVRPGLWPAFWTLGTDGPWPSNGEIDIMEYYKGHLLANVASGTRKPYTPKWNSVKTPLTDFPDDWAEDFHVWRMDWDEEAIRLYVDDRLLNETLLKDTFNHDGDRIANPFNHPQYILLNMAIGGDNGGNPSGTEFPARFEIDYVRVYQKENKK
ncbi:family 16 glycosylhydrolase [Pontiellaceae bacterium B12227]|nr:family 16 glycosylhydrolase [Pontiellaceae bacterium B12227]